jgi:hypothetical protein
MKILLHPAYFPNVLTMACLVQGDIIWEVCDNYQKQTYRNRCIIANDRGKQMLNIPIQHTGSQNGRQLTRLVVPEETYNWQRLHWRSLETAYRSAPYFEFYEEELKVFFSSTHHNLLNLNLNSTALLCRLINCDFRTAKTSEFNRDHPSLIDARFLISAKSDPVISQPNYPQVFEERHGFISDLSTLDLLFNEGPNSLTYLKDIVLPWNA